MTRKNYDAKKASAEDTAIWIMADVHRALSEGRPTVTLKLEHVAEVMNYVASIKERERIEFEGKPLGYCQAGEMHKFLQAEVKRLVVIHRKTGRFNTRVSFTEIGEVIPDAYPVAKPEQIVEDSPC